MSRRPPRQEDTAGRGPQRSLIAGVFLLTVFGPLVVTLAWGLPESLLTRYVGIPVVTVDTSLTLQPPITAGGVDVDAWLGELVRDVLTIGLAVGYIGSTVLASVGGLIVVGTVAITQSASPLWSAVRTMIKRRLVQGLLVLYLLVGVGLVYPVVMRVLTELFIALLVATPVVGVLGAGLSRLRDNDRLLVQVVGVYPLALACVVVPVVAVGVVSPTLQPIVWTISNEIALVILDTILGGGTVAVWLREQFDLAGVSLVAMWIGIVFLVGVSIGVLVQAGTHIRRTS